jgi:adenine/guanine phosphoribosyltransferase-like PRPP-binding protein
MPSALARQLESLAHDIVATPGAGGALLAAYAAQARALQLVVEAARRGGQSPLPHAVLAAAQEALETPSTLVGLV